MTIVQLSRLQDTFDKIAKEVGDVQEHGNTVYYFGSELATLRLAVKYMNHPKASHGYSSNFKTYFFGLSL